MDRPHYRRITNSIPDAGDKHGDQPKRSTFSERLVIQFIICGVIMALILVVNLADTSLAQNIKGIIQGQTSTDDVKQVLNEASDTVRTIFGNTFNDNALDKFDLASDMWMYNNEESSDSPSASAETDPSDQTAALLTPGYQTQPDFRIDEDILTQIQADSGGR